jgi:superfamily II DNA/RNA helicase
MRRLKIKVILTTDLLSRGVDLPQVNLVINFDVPRSKSVYLHRIGRTGRFGVKGIALSFLEPGAEFLEKSMFL